MLSSGETAQLRELQRRAYAPGGALTDAEARRLEELQALARGVTPALTTPADTSEGGDAADGDAAAWQPFDPRISREVDQEGLRFESEALDDRDIDAGDLERAGEGSGESPARAKVGLRGILKRRWFPYASVAFALLIGFCVGFAVFGQAAVQAVALSLAAGAEQAELETEGVYDPGSITPLDQVLGATIWHATRQDGDTQCLLLTAGDRSESTCIPTDQFDEQGAGLHAAIALPADEEGDTSSLNVGVVRGLDGELDVTAQRMTWALTWDWRSQYTEDELSIIDRIERETGIGGEALQIVGYDGDRPIWLEYIDSGKCVIVAVVDGVERACTQHADEDVTLEIAEGDGGVTRYHVAIPNLRGPTLTIERVPAPVLDPGIDDRTGDVES